MDDCGIRFPLLIFWRNRNWVRSCGVLWSLLCRRRSCVPASLWIRSANGLNYSYKLLNFDDRRITQDD